MNLLELKQQVDRAIKNASESGVSAEDVVVAVQIYSDDPGIRYSHKEVEMNYYNNGRNSGCVLLAFGSVLDDG